MASNAAIGTHGRFRQARYMSERALLKIARGSAIIVLCGGLATAGADTPTHWESADTTSGFRGWRQHLGQLARRGGHSKVNHFCIVVADQPKSSSDGGYIWAYVHWRETAQLYTFAPSDEEMSDMTQFKLQLDLHKDVVATERQINGSTYLVTRAWVTNILSHCARFGTQLVVER